jgi:signal transduction histidine kinase
MDRMKILKNTFNIFLISCLYLVIFIGLYAFLKSPAVVLISIVFVSYISWKRGTAAGLTLSMFNFFWNTAAFNLISWGEKFPIEGYISIAIHAGVSFLLGYFGKLEKNLRREVEIRKQTEAQLKEYQNELELRVEARTRELEKANEKLHQAERMETIGQLAGGIAHDFNNYLNIILGYSSLLIANLDTLPSEKESAEKIEEAATSASELASQLLTFARKKKFELQPVDITDEVDRMIPLLTRGVKKTVTIKHVAEPDIPIIQGGPSQIQNALINLGLNANDAMMDGGTIMFSTKNIEVTPDYCHNYGIACSPGKYVGIAVSDNGTGIEPMAINHLFEPFFTTKPEGKGTGMGLAAVYGIAKSHQGAVFVETELGKGTTFTMLFPVFMKIGLL